MQIPHRGKQSIVAIIHGMVICRIVDIESVLFYIFKNLWHAHCPRSTAERKRISLPVVDGRFQICKAHLCRSDQRAELFKSCISPLRQPAIDKNISCGWESSSHCPNS